MMPARIIHKVVAARLVATARPLAVVAARQKAEVATPTTPSRVAVEPRIAVIQIEAATTT